MGRIFCAAAVILAFASCASAQHRPAAWDTRVPAVPPAAAEPQPDKSAADAKEQPKKPAEAARPKTKPKLN